MGKFGRWANSGRLVNVEISSGRTFGSEHVFLEKFFIFVTAAGVVWRWVVAFELVVLVCQVAFHALGVESCRSCTLHEEVFALFMSKVKSLAEKLRRRRKDGKSMVA